MIKAFILGVVEGSKCSSDEESDSSESTDNPPLKMSVPFSEERKVEDTTVDDADPSGWMTISKKKAEESATKEEPTGSFAEYTYINNIHTIAGIMCKNSNSNKVKHNDVMKAEMFFSVQEQVLDAYFDCERREHCPMCLYPANDKVFDKTRVDHISAKKRKCKDCGSTDWKISSIEYCRYKEDRKLCFECIAKKLLEGRNYLS